MDERDWNSAPELVSGCFPFAPEFPGAGDVPETDAYVGAMKPFAFRFLPPIAESQSSMAAPSIPVGDPGPSYYSDHTAAQTYVDSDCSGWVTDFITDWYQYD